MKKWCFVAREVKGGWRLKLAYGSKDYPVRGVVFRKIEEVERLTHDGKVVFIHLKNSKYPEKKETTTEKCGMSCCKSNL